MASWTYAIKTTVKRTPIYTLHDQTRELRKSLRIWLRRSSLFHFYAIPKRLMIALSYRRGANKRVFHWLSSSRESTNFTYDLNEINIKYLSSYLSVVADVPQAEIEGYIQEIQDDSQLARHVHDATLASPMLHFSDPEFRPGRRIGWYALVRAKKPRIVVETGIDKGLGSCVLAAALIKNRAEGFPGTYYGTDLNPEAGYLFTAPYSEAGEILHGDSIQSLQNFPHQIDFFINDSDHSADYEMGEYQTVESKLAPGAIIIGDNAHCTDKLFQFAMQSHRRFLFFREQPKDHWYPGGGIGASW